MISLKFDFIFADRSECISMKLLSFRTLTFERSNWRYAIVVLRSHVVGFEILEMEAASSNKTLKESAWRKGQADSQIIHLDCYYYKSTCGALTNFWGFFRLSFCCVAIFAPMIKS